MTAAVHLTLAGRPGPSPHTRIVSGPNPKIAMARALLVKATAAAPVIWEWVRRGAAMVAKTPGWVGHAVLGVLSTPAGYSSAVQLVGTGVKAGWRLLDRAVCLAGRGFATVTGLAASTVGHIAPTWGQALVSAHADAVDAVNSLHEHVVHRVIGLGQRLEQLAHTPLVKTTATRAAAAASGLLVLHLVTKGLLASKALEVAPSLAGLVVALTSPWWLLIAVTSVTVGTLAGGAYLEIGKADMLQDLVVNIAADGSITVEGLPDWLPEGQKRRAAEGAVQVAQSEARRAVPGRRTLQSSPPRAAVPRVAFRK
jgi:hypothetical protein